MTLLPARTTKAIYLFTAAHVSLSLKLQISLRMCFSNVKRNARNRSAQSVYKYKCFFLHCCVNKFSKVNM